MTMITHVGKNMIKFRFYIVRASSTYYAVSTKTSAVIRNDRVVENLLTKVN